MTILNISNQCEQSGVHQLKEPEGIMCDSELDTRKCDFHIFSILSASVLFLYSSQESLV